MLTRSIICLISGGTFGGSSARRSQMRMAFALGDAIGTLTGAATQTLQQFFRKNVNRSAASGKARDALMTHTPQPRPLGWPLASSASSAKSCNNSKNAAIGQ